MSRPPVVVLEPAHLSRVIAGLSASAAYPYPVGPVEVHQTHISVVFLAGPFAFKVKKPLAVGFLDYSTLDRRRHFCEEEVRLNRRLAPGVYHGVVPITEGPAGALAVESDGPVVEWAVKMERLPADATLAAHVARDDVAASQLVAVARRVASFHAGAEGGKHVAAFGRFAVVSRNARENFAAPAASGPLCERLRGLTEAALGRLHGLIEDRADRGVPRDAHGDLRLDHVYLRPTLPPPHDLVIVDGIEFDERFRYSDPVSDAAFLVMDLIAASRRDLAQFFAEAYFEASGDDEGRQLLPFYVAYRAAVRAKVELMTAAEPEVPPDERNAARDRAYSHWLLALGALEAPLRRPCLILVGGLPGAGKSTLARGLAETASLEVVRSDLVRKALGAAAGIPGGPSSFGTGLYDPAWTERTYEECLRQTVSRLEAAGRLAVDASFAREAHRRAFLDAAAKRGVPAVWLVCQADPATVQTRLANRPSQGDASDADWSIHREASARWEPPAASTLRLTRTIETSSTLENTLPQAHMVLKEFGLVD